MIELLTTNALYKSYNKAVKVMLIQPGDPPPIFGKSVGVDTETELITDTRPDPPLVVLGIFDPEKAVCYICYWQEAPMIMRALNASDTQQIYFNVGFDEMVLDNEDKEKTLLDAIDANRVYDMQIRTHLSCIADPELGYIPGNRNTLEQCVQHYENVALDKGDGSDESHRLTFKRHTPDGQLATITMKQAEYLAHDCISTWCLSKSVPESPKDPILGIPIELAHVKGMIVLAHISRTGCLVDMRVYHALLDKLHLSMEKFRKVLVAQGFPDPDKSAPTERDRTIELLDTRLHELFDKANVTMTDDFDLNKDKARRLIMGIFKGDDYEAIANAILSDKALRKAEKQTWEELCENGLGAIDRHKSPIVMIAYVAELLGQKFAQADWETADDEAQQAAERFIKVTEPIGPKKFFQNHVKELLSKYKGLHLSQTEKSGDIQLTKNDMWRLQDKGVEDEFLEAYTGYKHCEKLISTYLNPEYIKADGKVHPRYHNIKRTGRTSCVRPNMQNLPARDHEYPMRNMYCAPEGAILCATDFSFVELVALSESCIRRFGHSTLGAIINAGVDPHRWFAGVRDGIITSDLSFTSDPEKIVEISAYLKEHVSKEARQAAKAANFGFGGGMSAKRFYTSCREQDMPMTEDLAEQLRDQWINVAFKEMARQLSPERMPKNLAIRAKYGYVPQDDDDEEEDKGENNRHEFMATAVNGMVRMKASFCAACNFQFQSLAAYGMKMAMWNVCMSVPGMIDRIVNMIHDEILYYLYPDEIDAGVIDLIEKAMIDGMRMATPNVKVGVETSCMLHWDKGAKEFKDIKRDEAGRLVIDEPAFVKELR